MPEPPAGSAFPSVHRSLARPLTLSLNPPPLRLEMSNAVQSSPMSLASLDPSFSQSVGRVPFSHDAPSPLSRLLNLCIIDDTIIHAALSHPIVARRCKAGSGVLRHSSCRKPKRISQVCCDGRAQPIARAVPRSCSTALSLIRPAFWYHGYSVTLWSPV